MSKAVKNNLSKIISIFILIQPVLDLITGVCLHEFNLNLTLGIIIRMLFLFFIVLITTFVYKKKVSIIYYLVFFIYSIIYLLVLPKTDVISSGRSFLSNKPKFIESSISLPMYAIISETLTTHPSNVIGEYFFVCSKFV